MTQDPIGRLPELRQRVEQQMAAMIARAVELWGVPADAVTRAYFERDARLFDARLFCEAADLLRDLLAVLPEQGQGWQPIETAPQDGREILVLTDTGSRLVTQWGSRAGWPDRSFWLFNAEHCKLTAWHALPAPPVDPSSV